MAHLAINVFGEFRVIKKDEITSSFESDKVRALLAYLVVEAGHPHRRESLAGIFWPDCSEPSALHNLSQALFNLRKVLGDHSADPPYLRITRDAIQFNLESDYSLDFEQFNTFYLAWEKGLGAGSDVVTLLEDLAGLYRGDFLQAFYLKDSSEFEEWILVQRATAHQRVMTVLTTLADEHEKHGDFLSARRSCLRQLALDPWREEAHGCLMRLLALEGQRSAALAQYEACKKILADELGVAPSSKTRELYEQIRLGRLQPRTEPQRPTLVTPVPKLPLPLTPFLGREKELAELAQMIADPLCRCISLVGPGGMGKTRLALEAAEGNKNAFIHGAAFIPLVSIRSHEAVVPATASGIGFAFHGPIDPKTQLLNYLANKNMLLILDNVEHLLSDESNHAAITDLILEILRQAPQVKLLITSREALNIAEEWLYEVQGLAYPRDEHGEWLNEYSAVALFLQHARRVRPGFTMEAGNQKYIASLCRMVEGMPLAIELAATWVRVLSPEEIVAEINRSLDFLNTQMRDIPERHRSIRAVFEPSWQMLPLEEKQILCRLSVFRGGFTRPAAEQVAGASLLALSSLVIRSLVRRMGTGRYDIHELIRQYAASKLAEDPVELHRVQEQHSLYYLGLLEAKDTLLRSQHQKATLDELIGEMDNIRAAWDWAAQNQKVKFLYRASTTLWYLFELHNWFREGELTFLSTAEALRGPTAEDEDIDTEIARAAMLAHGGCFLLRQGKSQAAYAILAPCVESLRTSRFQTRADPFPMTYAMGYMGVVCWEMGKFSDAKEHFQEARRFAQAFAQPWYEALLTEFLGVVANDQGEYLQASQYLNHALAIFRQSGDPSYTAHALSYLGRTMQALGEYGEAEKLLREGLDLAQRMDYRFGSGLALDALGQVAYAQGKFAEALEYFLESATLFREMADTHRLARTLNHQGMTRLALNQVVEAQDAFRDALTLAQSGGLISIALAAMAGLAALQVRQGGNAQTLELVLYLVQHPVSNQETRDLARGLQKELETKLSREAVGDALRSAGETDMDMNAIIAQLLAGT